MVSMCDIGRRRGVARLPYLVPPLAGEPSVLLGIVLYRTSRSHHEAVQPLWWCSRRPFRRYGAVDHCPPSLPRSKKHEHATC